MLEIKYNNQNKENINLKNEKIIRKKCVGCLDPFTCSQSQNYDYCSKCELNGSRYISQPNQCPECGNGSGIIKFPNQPPRSCKLCFLTHQEKRENVKLHELMAKIIHKELRKVYDKKSPYHGNQN